MPGVVRGLFWIEYTAFYCGAFSCALLAPRRCTCTSRACAARAGLAKPPGAPYGVDFDQKNFVSCVVVPFDSYPGEFLLGWCNQVVRCAGGVAMDGVHGSRRGAFSFVYLLIFFV